VLILSVSQRRITYGEFRDNIPRHARLLLDVLLAAKREIHRALIHVYSTGKNIYGKTARGFDTLINRILIDTFRSFGFEGTIISEESIDYGNDKEFIIIDPVDGSLNVVKRIPAFAVSLAYSQGDSLDDILSGLIWTIVPNEFFLGIKGFGAFKLSGSDYVNIERIKAERRDFAATLIDVGFTTSAILERLRDFGEIRITGSITFSITRVAEGYLDAIFDVSGSLRFNDIAAGIPLLSEAGAKMEAIPLGPLLENPRVLFLASCDSDVFNTLKKVFEGEVQEFAPL